MGLGGGMETSPPARGTTEAPSRHRGGCSACRAREGLGGADEALLLLLLLLVVAVEVHHGDGAASDQGDDDDGEEDVEKQGSDVQVLGGGAVAERPTVVMEHFAVPGLGGGGGESQWGWRSSRGGHPGGARGCSWLGEVLEGPFKPELPQNTLGGNLGHQPPPLPQIPVFSRASSQGSVAGQGSMEWGLLGTCRSGAL